MFGTFIPTPPARAFVFQGDSHTAGNFDPANAWPIFLNAYPLLSSCPFHNLAKNGDTAQGAATDYLPLVRPFAPRITGVPSNYWLHIGSNNIAASGDSGAAVYALVAPVLAQAKADGFFVGCTQIWGDPTLSAPKAQAVLDYNALLATDPSVTPGLLFNGYTTIVPFNSPPYYLTDNNHLNPTGQAFYAQNVYGLLTGSGNII